MFKENIFLKQYMECYLKPVLFGFKYMRRSASGDLSWMRKDISNMGAAYVKVGQFVATRTDVFPKKLTMALADLHDNVCPAPFESIANILQQECDLDQFMTIEETPISSASIGQIHRCVLKEYPDTPLVMKVQKPGVEEQIKQDFEALTNIIQFCCTIAPANRMLTDLYNIVEQCKRSVYQELDFVNERKNIKALRDAFQETSITVPRVVGKLSTRRVIIQEYVPSARLAPGADTTELVKSVCLSGLKYGVIHGDMHPGNIGIKEDGFVFYDSGAIIYVDPTMIKDLFVGILTKNVNLVTEKLLANKMVHVIKEPIGRLQLTRAVHYVVDYIDHVDVQKLVRQVSEDSLLNTNRLYFRIDPDLFLLSRTMSLLEGTCKSVNDKFAYNDILLDMITDTDVVMQYMDLSVLVQRGIFDLQRLQNTQSSENIDLAPDDNYMNILVIMFLVLNLIL